MTLASTKKNRNRNRKIRVIMITMAQRKIMKITMMLMTTL
jgi:hypothetical protein